MERQRIPIQKLVGGMTVASDVLHPSGRKLVSEGTTVTPNLAYRLKSIFSSLPHTDIEIWTAGGAPGNQYSTTQKAPSIGEDLLTAAEQLERSMTALSRGETLPLESVETAVVNLVNKENPQRHIWQLVEHTLSVDPNLYNHGVAVAGLCAVIARWQDFSSEQIFEASLSGYFHDIGKVWASNKNHPLAGVQLLQEHASMSLDVLRGIRDHHERNDGSGYPRGLKAPEISTYGRITAVANAFHNGSQELNGQRPFLLPLAEHIVAEAPRFYDPVAAKALLASLIPFYQGRSVRLSSGEKGQIVFIDPERAGRPLVMTDDSIVDCSTETAASIDAVL